MNHVKIFLQDIVDKSLIIQKRQEYGIDNNNNGNIDILNLYDSVKKFIAPNYDKTNDKQPDATDMSELETEESTEQEGQGQQMLTRLPVLLAQLQARNNSQKLKNEIKQLLYLLYRSKKLSKTIYNSLMNTI